MLTGSRVVTGSRIAGAAIASVALVALVLAPFVGDGVSATLWGVEPLTYLGAVLMILGLSSVAASFFLGERLTARASSSDTGDVHRQWSELTEQTFDLLAHDLGRPFSRVLARERELRAAIDAAGGEVDPALAGLLEEIERQGPNFRLMLANMQVLVQLEAPSFEAEYQPVEPSEVVRRIVERYSAAASDLGKEISWWSEPAEFGIVYSDNAAVEHVVTNLIDNAVRFAAGHVEVKLTKNPTHFFVRVWDDGPGIAPQYLPHIFDRGWTPEVPRRDEKVSSGLGLHISRALTRRFGGDVTIETQPGAESGHHTSFLASLRNAIPDA